MSEQTEWQRIGPRGVDDGDWCPDPAGEHRHSWVLQGEEHATCIFCGKLGYKIHNIPWREGEYTGHSNPSAWYHIDQLQQRVRYLERQLEDCNAGAVGRAPS